MLADRTYVHWEDVVGSLLGLGGTMLRHGVEIYEAALNGDERAGDLCVKLDEGELTINSAYKAFKSRRKPSAKYSEAGDEDPEEGGQDEVDRKAIEDLTRTMHASLPTLRREAGDSATAGKRPPEFARCMYDACEALRQGDYGVGPFVADMMKEYLRAARTRFGDEGVLSCVLDAGVFDDRLEGFKMSLWVRTMDISWWDPMMRNVTMDVPVMAHLEGRWEDDEETQ
ncbi:MAG: hypothetical protein ACM3X3_09935 [Betaproteobacteria bacterium]